MVKVPATPAGIPAIRRLLGKGLNINITLLFSSAVYEQVVEALSFRTRGSGQSGGDVPRAPACQLFVSRIDAAVDKRLKTISDKSAAGQRGARWAIAKRRWPTSATKCCSPGPAGTSSPKQAPRRSVAVGVDQHEGSDYKDHDVCRGADRATRWTHIPPATMDAFRDHGRGDADAREQDLEGARRTMAALEKRQGISLKEVTDELVKEGVQSFADSFDKLLAVVAQRRRVLLDGERSVGDQAGSPEVKPRSKRKWRLAPRTAASASFGQETRPLDQRG